MQALIDVIQSEPAIAAGQGPLAVILAEDPVEVTSTVAHHLRLGFGTVLVLDNTGLVPAPAPELAGRLIVVPLEIDTRAQAVIALNHIIQAAAGRWMFWCYNAEYLIFPFCETRVIQDALTFMEEERRMSVYTYELPLYAPDLRQNPNGVCLTSAHFDAVGYFGMNRQRDGQWRDREIDVHGSLRWRFEEFLPAGRHRLDRVALFRARADLSLSEDLIFNDDEYNTISCPWHHNMTAAVASFRVAKALRHNPAPRAAIDSFMWEGSCRFSWTSQQLLELGFIEPGQWF